MQPTYRQIEYLRAVAESGSFSAAADKCHVTQSTLSAGVKDLENILGIKLFVRTSREVYLTPEGQVLYEESHHIYEDMHRFVKTAKGFSSDKGGVLRLGMIPTVAPFFIKPLYSRLNKNYPDMHIHIHEDVSAALMNGLNQRKLDIVILAFPYPIGSYGHDVIGSDSLHLIAHKDLGLGNAGKKLSIYDIHDLAMIMLADGHCLRDHALAACSIGERSVAPSYQAVTIASLMEMVSAGLGATLMPRLLLENRSSVLSDDVIQYDFEQPVPERQLGLVWQRQDLKPYANEIGLICKGLIKP